MKKLLLALACAATLTACGTSPLFENEASLPTFTNAAGTDLPGWRYADSLKLDFTAGAAELGQPLDVVFGVRVKPEYAYRNLWVAFSVQGPDGKRTNSLREFVLADAEGNWHVSESGGAHGYEQVLLGGVQLQQAGAYRIVATQFMRHDTLPGIESIRLAVEPSRN